MGSLPNHTSMPVKRPQFVNEEIYHIIVRGTAGQEIFLERKDYLRYLLSLYQFNDKKMVLNAFRFSPDREVFPIKPPEVDESRETLIQILAFCLMPNHVHLLVRQVADDGISLFFQKMGGYSSYFNKKYQRFGALFQRPFRAIHIETEDQLLIVITYIHLNPTDLIEPNWKNKGISNPQKVMEFLESYPRSSYPYYLGKEDFSWLIGSSFLKKILKNPEDFRNFVKARVFHKTKLKNFLNKARELFLE